MYSYGLMAPEQMAPGYYYDPYVHVNPTKLVGDSLNVTWNVRNTATTSKTAVLQVENLTIGGSAIAASGNVTVPAGATVLLAAFRAALQTPAHGVIGANNMRVALYDAATLVLVASHAFLMTLNALPTGGLEAVGDPSIV